MERREEQPPVEREADRLKRENPSWTGQDGAGDAGRSPGDIQQEPKPDDGANRLGRRDVPFRSGDDPVRGRD